MKFSTKDLLWIAVSLAGLVYGYGALNTRVSALEENKPIQMGQDIAVLKSDVGQIKNDVKDIKKALKVP